MAKTKAVVKSENTKLRTGGRRGPDPKTGKPWKRKKGKKDISATYRTADTCPDSCPFKASKICYAHDVTNPRQPTAFQVAERLGIEDTNEALDPIRDNAPYKGLVRHLVSGDVSSENEQGEVDDDYIEAANKLHEDRPDLEGYGYTHDWERIDPTSVKGWTLNASTETPEQAAEAIRRGWNVVIESPEDQDLSGQVIEGQKVQTCPNQLYHNVGCADCKLCLGKQNKIIQFLAHGRNQRRVSEAINAARSGPVSLGSTIPVGAPSAEHFKAGFSDGSGPVTGS